MAASSAELSGMSLAKRIHNWLQGPRHYADGLAILKAAETLDDAQLFFLELGESSTTRAELLEEIELLHQEHLTQAKGMAARNVAEPMVTKATIAAERRMLTRTSDGFDGVQLPADLHQLRNVDLKAWYKERSYLCGRLEVLASDDDRLRDALRIKELDGLIKSAYARLDAFGATGRDPGEPQQVTKSAVDLVRRLRSVESYLSRARSGKRPASPAKQKLWEDEAAEIKKLIDALPKD